MKNLLISFLKSKKNIAFIFLFLVSSFVFLLALPHIAIAAEIIIDGQSHYSPLDFSADTADLDGKIANNRSIFESFMIVLGQLIVNGAYQISAICMIILAYVIGFLEVAITKDPRFLAAWASMRDFANMIIVLGFVIIGIATTLRIREYEAKKILWRLILIALFVNFSNIFVGLMIDASNIITKGLGGGSSGLMPYTILLKLNKASSNYLNPQLTTESSKFLGSCALFAFVYLGVAFTFIYMAFILLARYAILILLFILSPLAFVFWVFPASRFKKYQTEWWEAFIKWCLVGVFASLVLSLGTTIMTTQDALNNNSDLPSLFIACTVVLLFLYVGFKMTAKHTGLASVAAGAMMGLAGGAVGLAAGAGMGTLKGLGKGADAATGGRLSGAGQKISSGIGRSMEALGFRKAGATAQGRSGELGESEKRYSALVAQGDLARVQRIAKGEGIRVTPKERAGAVAALLKSKNFDSNDTKQVAGLNYFQNQGGNLGEYSAKDPRLAKHDISATRNTITKEKAKGIVLTEEQAAQKNVDGGYARLGVRGMRDLSDNAMNLDFIRNTNSDKNAKAADEYSDAQIAQQKKFITKGTTEHGEWKAKSAELKAQGTPEALAERRRILKNILEIKNNPNFK